MIRAHLKHPLCERYKNDTRNISLFMRCGKDDKKYSIIQKYPNTRVCTLLDRYI